MENKNVGENAMLSGKLDDVPVFLFNMKEPAFNMKIMSTYGDLTQADNQEQTRRYFKDANGVM